MGKDQCAKNRFTNEKTLLFDKVKVFIELKIKCEPKIVFLLTQQRKRVSICVVQLYSERLLLIRIAVGFYL